MKQMSLMQTAEEKAFEEVRPALEDVLKRYRIDEDRVFLAWVKSGYYSIYFDTKLKNEKNLPVIARLGGKKKQYIAVRTSYLRFSKAFNSAATQSKDGYSKIYLSTFDDVKKYSSLLQEILQAVMRNLREFDCCGRYMECSNAKQCTHPDPEYALKCGYQFILQDGRIFYGSNRTVDI